MECFLHRSYSVAILRYFAEEAALAKPDLIILDILMPAIMGTDLLRYIRQDAAYRTTPTIVLSGVLDDKLRASAALAGGDLHLQKPVTAEVLLSAVAGCLLNARRRESVTVIEVQDR